MTVSNMLMVDGKAVPVMDTPCPVALRELQFREGSEHLVYEPPKFSIYLDEMRPQARRYMERRDSNGYWWLVKLSEPRPPLAFKRRAWLVER